MRVSIENSIYMDCPEGFHQLTEEEKGKMGIAPGGNVLCIYDPERQIVINVERTPITWLTSWLLGRREVAWSMSRQIEKKLRHLDYTWIGSAKRQIDGLLARGMDYEYVAKGVHMSCESLAVLSGEDLFYFHMYARKVRRKDSQEAFEEVLDSVYFVK